MALAAVDAVVATLAVVAVLEVVGSGLRAARLGQSDVMPAALSLLIAIAIGLGIVASGPHLAADMAIAGVALVDRAVAKVLVATIADVLAVVANGLRSACRDNRVVMATVAVGLGTAALNETVALVPAISRGIIAGRPFDRWGETGPNFRTFDRGSHPSGTNAQCTHSVLQELVDTHLHILR